MIGPADDGRIEDLLADKSEKQARQRLQALIAEWLRMENLVILTGAGCSVTTGGKTMAGLEKAVMATVVEIEGAPDSIGGILAERAKDDADETKPPWARTNFEDWLTYLVSAAHLSSETASPFSGVNWRLNCQVSLDDLKWLIEATAKSIFAECALILKDAPAGAASAADISPHLAFLAKLVVRDSNLGRAHLFTLNYDTLFEQALELLGIQYFDGFTGRAESHFDPSVYGLDIYYPGEVAEGRVRRFDKFVHLYKLHGSIHWKVEGGELRARHPDLIPFADFAKLDSKAKATKLAELGVPCAGILPTANKFVQTLTMPYAHLFRSFRNRLSAPQTFLLVLGYGFGDDHVTRLIETALVNPSLVMLVVEPNPKSPVIERIQRYKELGKRAFVLTATDAAFGAEAYQAASFDDFARSVMPDVQWLEDFLRLRRFEKQIQGAMPDEGPPADSASAGGAVGGLPPIL